MRCLDIGISLSDLGDITVGEIMDIYIEKMNDSEDYEEVEQLQGDEILKFLGVN